MSTSHVIVTIFAALFVGYSAVAVLIRASWVTDSLVEYGVQRSWWNWLGAAKLAGAAGLLVGLAVPPLGVAAAIALVLYFAGAVTTVVRAHWYSHIPYPLMFMAPVVGSLALKLAS